MNIKDIMTKTIVIVEMDDSLNMIKEIFDNTRFHHILVIEAGKLYGVISDRDLLKALGPNIGTLAETTTDLAVLNKKAHQIMTRKPVTLTTDAEIQDAVNIFNENNISCIPVVDKTYKPVGIISWRDILKTLASNRGKQ